jgi:hypothetical protein
MFQQIKSFFSKNINIATISGYQAQNDINQELSNLINQRYSNINNTFLEVMQKIQNTNISIPYQIEKNGEIVNNSITVQIEQLLSYPSPRQQTFEMLINDITEELLLNGVFYLMYEKKTNTLKCVKTNELTVNKYLSTNNRIPFQYLYHLSQGTTEYFNLKEDNGLIYFINNNYDNEKFLFASEIEFENYNILSSVHLSKSPLHKIGLAILTQKSIIDKNYFLTKNKKEADLLLVSGKNLITGEKKEELKAEITDKINNANQSGLPCVIILGGEEIKMDLKKINDNIFESQFIDLYNHHAKHIYQYFGLPIEKGLEQAKYSNAENSSIEYLEQAVKPKLNFIYSNLSYILSVIFNYNKTEYQVKPNYNEHSIVKQYKLSEITQLSNIATLNERRHTIGYMPLEGGDTINNQDANLFSINENNISNS